MRFFRTITKPKFVIALIALVLVAAFLGVLIPQESYKKASYFQIWKVESPQVFYLVELLHLDRIYSSIGFLALVALVLLSLGYSIYEQIKRNIHAMRSAPLQREDSGGDGSGDEPILTPALSLKERVVEEERLIRFMKKRRYALKNRNNDALVFSKNSINRWGSVIFHSGLFLIIVAAIIGLAFQTRGFAQVVEGTIFSGRDADFLTKDPGALSKRFETGFKIRLNKFQHTYWDTGETRSYASSVSAIQGDSISDHTIAENDPLVLNGVRVFQSAYYGYALSFLIMKPTGEQVVTHFLLDKPDKPGKPAVGKNVFETTDYVFDMTFYPDINKPSFFPAKPIVFLKIAEAGTPVFQGLMIPGQAVRVKNDILQFAAIRNWTGLSFSKDTGAGLAYAGFVIALIGIITNYLLPYKEVSLKVGGSVPAISGWTKKYPALFEEELRAMKEEINCRAQVPSAQREAEALLPLKNQT